MEIFAKGQLSYMILNCLLERDFYGLDFISEISNKSSGRINLKKPSVYSNLTRMEKQGYVSSYSKASDFGPNRRYYSITEKGRNFYQQLKNDFAENNIDVFRDFKDTNDSPDEFKGNIADEEKDFFDFSSLNDSKEKEMKHEDSMSSEGINVIDNAPDETNNVNKNEEQRNNAVENISQMDPMQDDGSFLEKQKVDSYNQRLYDISKDIRKYKKQRSFAEDQIAMTVETPLSESEEKTRASLEQFKSSLMENRKKFANDEALVNEFDRYNERQNRANKLDSVAKGNTYFQNKPIQEVVEDDGKFITSRLENENLMRPKKIQPPRLKILQNDRQEILPPPNRDVKIDPSHKEIISQLYSKTKDGKDAEGSGVNILYDYQDLQDYYNEQEVSFKEYKRSNLEIKHNTNKLIFIQSILVFFLLSISSALTFLILNYVGVINKDFNFLYYLLPALQLIVVSLSFYNYKFHTSWLPKKMISVWEMIGYTLLIIAGIIGINFIFGLNSTNFELYATTLILPCVLTLVILPISYFIKKALIIKYWK